MCKLLEKCYYQITSYPRFGPGGLSVRNKQMAGKQIQRTHPHRLKAPGGALSRCDVVDTGTLSETCKIERRKK